MYRTVYLSFWLLFMLNFPANSQEQDNAPANNSVSAKWEYYPAGNIFSFRMRRGLTNHGHLYYGLGYNIARRQDFGKHELEEGSGPGLTFSYRYFLKPAFKGLFIDGNLGIWSLKINWEDDRETPQFMQGSTRIWVLQPTLGVGYQFSPKNSAWSFEGGIAGGIEWNVITNGSPVGQGGISILFLGFSRQF